MKVLEKFFRLGYHKTTVKRELLAGFTIFSTVAYAIVVVPMLLTTAGLPFEACLISTVLTGAIATLIMGLGANYPFVFFPGISMSAFFTYTIVIQNHLSWQAGMGLLFLVSLAMMILWVTRLREWIIHAIPLGLKLGTTAGIGLYLVLVSLKNADIVVANPHTLIGSGDLLAPKTVLFVFGIVLISALMSRKIHGAILIGVLVNWAIGLAFGLVKWKGIIGIPQFSTQTFFALDIPSAFSLDHGLLFFSFLMVYLFDTSGTLMGLAHQGKFFNKNGNLPRFRLALLPDTIGSMVSALFGTSAAVPYVESAAGVAAGGRTGLTSTVVGVLFLASLFFMPLAASIPFFAAGPVLVIIGALMLRSVLDFKWDDPSDLIPCYATVIAIPYLFSIGNGIGVGVMLYPICKLLSGKWREVHPLLWILAILFVLKFIYA